MCIVENCTCPHLPADFQLVCASDSWIKKCALILNLLLTLFIYTICKLIRTNAVIYSVFVQQVANEDHDLGWRSEVTHHVVRNVRMYFINRNKNNPNLSLLSISTLKYLKQYTKEFSNTLDMHG